MRSFCVDADVVSFSSGPQSRQKKFKALWDSSGPLLSSCVHIQRIMEQVDFSAMNPLLISFLRRLYTAPKRRQYPKDGLSACIANVMSREAAVFTVAWTSSRLPALLARRWSTRSGRWKVTH